MSIKKISKDQPEFFEFNDKNMEFAKKAISIYPEGKQQSAVMALLYIAQRQNKNFSGCSLEIFRKLIYQFLQIQYLKTLILQEHLPTCVL